MGISEIRGNSSFCAIGSSKRDTTFYGTLFSAGAVHCHPMVRPSCVVDAHQMPMNDSLMTAEFTVTPCWPFVVIGLNGRDKRLSASVEEVTTSLNHSHPHALRASCQGDSSLFVA